MLIILKLSILDICIDTNKRSKIQSNEKELDAQLVCLTIYKLYGQLTWLMQLSEQSTGIAQFEWLRHVFLQIHDPRRN